MRVSSAASRASTSEGLATGGSPPTPHTRFSPVAELLTRRAGLPVDAVVDTCVAVAERLCLAEIVTIEQPHLQRGTARRIDAVTPLPR